MSASVVSLSCPTCKSARMIYFDHTAGTVTATCPKCGPGTVTS